MQPPAPVIRPRLALLPALALVASGAAAQPRPFRPEPPGVAHLPVQPPGLGQRPDDPGRRHARRCVAIDDIAGATVLGDRTIELELRDGGHLHMRFAADCPFLGFYQGFYYRRKPGGRLCAGDSVIARSGGACPIDGIERHRRPR